MYAKTILALLFASMATGVVSSPMESSTNDIVSNFPSEIMARSELVERACNCGKAFSCNKSVTECCKSTGGYGMCKTDIGQCKCGTQCNPLQCKW